MSLIQLDDYRAFPVQPLEVISLGPLDPEWQPSPAHIAIVSAIHATVSVVAALAVVAVVLVTCLVIGG